MDNRILTLEQMRSMVSSGKNWIRKGAPITPDDILQKRKSTCSECEFWKKESFNGSGACGKCGCSTLIKLRMATEKCPMGKW